MTWRTALQHRGAWISIWFALACFGMLAACGIDGEPIPPGEEQAPGTHRSAELKLQTTVEEHFSPPHMPQQPETVPS